MVGAALEVTTGASRSLAATAPGGFGPRRFGAALRTLDPRVLQIVFLAALLTFGVLVRDFSLRPEQMLLAFAAGLATQYFWLRVLHITHAGYLSAIVTCFGLSILLRADSLWVHPLAAAAVMSSKFLVRVRGKHVFNPANLGVIGASTLLPGAWISPGQWGSDVAAAFLFLALGGVVATRARRLPLAWSFLAFYGLLLAGRTFWLGQPVAIWIHQVSSGALLLFAFFMISDPMTTPDRRGAAVAYAAIVAVGAFCWQFMLFRPNGLVWALFLASPLVPLIDRFWPGKRLDWRETTRPEAAPPPR